MAIVDRYGNVRRPSERADRFRTERAERAMTGPGRSDRGTPPAESNELYERSSQNGVMVRDRFAEESAPELQHVLDALDDRVCRTIIRHLETPMTASEIADECDVPVSTTYRKLDLLSEASLLAEQTEVRADGHHTTRYRPAFAAMWIALDADREFEVRIARPPRTADEQLAQLWSEVRKET